MAAGYTMSKILVVYDNRIFGDFVTFVVKTAGMEVDFLDDPLQLFDYVTANTPSLIIIDVFLNHVDGLYIIEKLRMVEEYRSIPILVVSSRNEPLSLFDALERGAVDYLASPINEDLLIEKVKKYSATPAG
jgi:PleD family two-component response regulator